MIVRTTSVLLSIAMPLFADVSFNTGHLQFSRTLMTTRGHTLSLPINLKYNSRLTTRQENAWAGLGFDLDVPYIERKIVAGPDDWRGNSYNYSAATTSWLDYLRIRYPGEATESAIENLHFDYLTFTPLVYKKRLNATTVEFRNGVGPLPEADECYTVNGSGVVTITDPDCPSYNNQTQQDLYYLRNFPKGDRRLFFAMGSKRTLTGQTGKDADSLFVALAPFAPWQVSYVIDDPSSSQDENAKIRSWTVFDQDGVEYTFDRVVGVSTTGRPYDVARVVYKKEKIEGGPDTASWRRLLTSLEKQDGYTASVRWYLTRIAWPGGRDSIRIEYGSIPTVQKDESPYYSDVTKFDVRVPQEGRHADTVLEDVPEDSILLGASSMGIAPPDSAWPEVPKARVRLKLDIRDFVVGRDRRRAAFYLLTPDTIFDYAGNVRYTRDRAWLMGDDKLADSIEAFVTGSPVEIDGELRSMDQYVSAMDPKCYAEIQIFWTDPQAYPSGNMSPSGGTRQGSEFSAPIVFRTEWDQYKNPDNSHFTWVPGDELPSFEYGCQSGVPCPCREGYESVDLISPEMFSGLIFDKTLTFKNPVTVTRIRLKLQGVNRCWEWVNYADELEVGARADRGDSVVAFPRRRSNTDSFLHTRLLCLGDAPYSSQKVARDALGFGVYFDVSVYPDARWNGNTIPLTPHIHAWYNKPLHTSAGEINDYYRLLKEGSTYTLNTQTQFRQVISRSERRTIVNSTYPTRIVTPLQEIRFSVGQPDTSEQWGRGRLLAITSTDLSSNELLQKIIFSYGPSCVSGRFQLEKVIEQRKNAGCHRDLYTFHYTNGSGLSNDMYFGNLNRGMIDSMTDVNGGALKYEYEKGWYNGLSDGSGCTPTENGYRIKKVTRSGVGVSLPVVTTIAYQDGEVKYGTGMTKAIYEGTETFKNYSDLCMTDYVVNYGKATVRTLGQSGRTEYLYATGRNAPELRDPRYHYYHIRDAYRNGLLSVKAFGSQDSVPKQSTVQKYYVESPGMRYMTDTVNGQVVYLNEGRYRFAKPRTTQGVFRLTKESGNYVLREKDAGYFQFLQPDLPEMPVATSDILGIIHTTTTLDGVAKTTYRRPNKKGLDSVTVVFKGPAGSWEGIKTVNRYFYQVYPVGFNENGKNALSPIVSRQTIHHEGGYDTRVLSTQVTNWSASSGPMLVPVRSYAWRMDKDQSGNPLSPYNSRSFLFSQEAPMVGSGSPATGYNGQWHAGEWIVRRTPKSSKPWWVCLPSKNQNTPYGNPTTINIYRGDNEQQIGTIEYNNTSKVDYREASVFTCDYHADGDSRYWDKLNCWERGWINPPTLSDTARFGRKSIYVVNDYAAGRNSRIFPGKSYTLSAWVRVDSGKIFMGCDYRYAKPNHQSDWPIDSLEGSDYGVDSVSMTAAACGGQWKLMQMIIPASRTSPFDTTKTWFARVFIGKGEFATSTGVKAYVDEIRFYPSDALVTTQHYDSRNRLVSTIDANNNASHAEYDEWDRPTCAKDNARNILQQYQYGIAGENVCGTSGRLKIVYPNGGEVLTVGSPIRIIWLSNDNPPKQVAVFYSVDGGINYHSISSAPVRTIDPGWGDYEWEVTLPSGVESSNQCLIKIIDVYETQAFDESDGYFTIVNETPG